MKILGFDKLSLVDYLDYTTAIIFVGGCNFKCPFCHNAGIVNITEEEISVAEIFEYLEKRKKLIDAVCISGGEPTIYPDLPVLIKQIKEMGFKVKLDTNGTNPTMLKELVDQKLIDYVAMDIKNSITEYGKTAGCVASLLPQVQESIEYLKQNNIPYEFRTTLIKEFHTDKSIEQMGELINGANIIYLQKFVENDNCLTFGLNEVSLADAERYKEILTKYVKQVKLRGYC